MRSNVKRSPCYYPEVDNFPVITYTISALNSASLFFLFLGVNTWLYMAGYITEKQAFLMMENLLIVPQQ